MTPSGHYIEMDSMPAAMAPWLSIIIPAYNEALRLPNTLAAIQGFLSHQGWLDRTEIIVANDGSSDGTAQVVTLWQARLERLCLLDLAHAGKGSAIRSGVLHARGEWIFLCDADLAMPIDEILRFLPPQSTADVTIGSRELPDSLRSNEPVYRHIMGRVFNRLVQWLLLPGIEDTQCGFKCLRGEIARRIFQQQRLNGMGFDIEVLALARLYGARIYEVPITWIHDRHSRVRPIRDTVEMMLDVFAVRQRIHEVHDQKATRSASRPVLPILLLIVILLYIWASITRRG